MADKAKAKRSKRTGQWRCMEDPDFALPDGGAKRAIAVIEAVESEPAPRKRAVKPRRSSSVTRPVRA
jgi:hypothetical protein